MWPMCKSISFWEEEDICVQHCIINTPGTAGGPGGRDRTLAVPKNRAKTDKICVQHCIINSNPDYQWYCTLVQCTVMYPLYSVYTSWLHSTETRDVVSILMGLEGETPPTHGIKLWTYNLVYLVRKAPRRICIIMQNFILKSERLRCHLKIFKTKETLQQKAILGNPLNIN